MRTYGFGDRYSLLCWDVFHSLLNVALCCSISDDKCSQIAIVHVSGYKYFHCGSLLSFFPLGHKYIKSLCGTSKLLSDYCTIVERRSGSIDVSKLNPLYQRTHFFLRTDLTCLLCCYK